MALVSYTIIVTNDKTDGALSLATITNKNFHIHSYIHLGKIHQKNEQIGQMSTKLCVEEDAAINFTTTILFIQSYSSFYNLGYL